MKVYGIKTCDTCRKAIKALEAAGHNVEFIDVRATPLSEDQISQFLSAFGDKLVNTRSTTWRELDAISRTTSPQVLLAEHPTLMKRPVIHGKDLHLGWGKDVQAVLL
jgi:Spx/MgsR family transcriptional regulator